MDLAMDFVPKLNPADSLEISEINQISSDALKSWSRCKRQFYYKHVKKLQWPSDIQHFRLGKDVHKLLDYQARGLDCSLLLQHSPMDVRVSWEKLMAHPVVHLPVVANEWAFHVPVALAAEPSSGQPLQTSLALNFPEPTQGRVEWLTGRIDRVARDGDRILVIDWKTGTGVPRNPEIDWQTRLYMYALVEVASSPSASDLGLGTQGPLRPEQVSFLYVEVKADPHTPVRLVPLPYGAEQHLATRQVLQTILGQMAVEEVYAVPDNRICPDKFCSYRSICGI
jgi:hypothetical protein